MSFSPGREAFVDGGRPLIGETDLLQRRPVGADGKIPKGNGGEIVDLRPNFLGRRTTGKQAREA